MKYIFACLGIGLLLGAVYLSYNNYMFYKVSVDTTGVVYSFVEKKDSEGDYLYAPAISFITHQGDNYRFVSSTSSSKPSLNLKEEVEVLYDVTNPHNARLAGFWYSWLGVFVLTLIGTVFSSFGFLFIRADRKT